MAKITRTTGPSSAVGASAEAHEEGGVPQPDVMADAAAPTPDDDPEDEDAEADAGSEEAHDPADEPEAGEGDGAEDPGDTAAVTVEPPPEDPGTEPAVSGRPPVNAPKAEHVAYAVAHYGQTDQWWDDKYSKRDLIDALNRLDVGEMAVAPDGTVYASPSGDQVVYSDVDAPADFT